MTPLCWPRHALTPENERDWQAMAAGALCSDCPPVGYPNDKTRCLPCPRRTMISITIQPCEACGSEGRIYRSAPTYYEPLAEADCGPCPYCEGTGGELIETFPVDPYDDWFAEYLAEKAREEEHDPEHDFFDGDGGHDLD